LLSEDLLLQHEARADEHLLAIAQQQKQLDSLRERHSGNPNKQQMFDQVQRDFDDIRHALRQHKAYLASVD